MRKIVEGYFHLLRVIIVLCLAAMVILVFGNVVLRYGFNTGIAVSEELSRWFFVYLTFLGAVVAMREHGHLGVDSLVKRLWALGKKAPASGLPVAWVYGVGIVFSVSVMLILLYDLYRIVSGRIPEDELVMVKESEEQAELEALQR